MQSAEMEKTRPSSDIMGARARGGLQLGGKADYKSSSHIPQTTYTPSAGPGRNYSLRNCPLPHAREKPQNYAQKAPKERDFKIFLRKTPNPPLAGPDRD